MIKVGEEFPNYSLQACMPDNSIDEIFTENEENGKWSVYYFYPKDFTFICPTEIREMDRLLDEDLNVVGISGDNEYCKKAWKESNPIIKDIRHPLAADSGLHLASNVGVDNHEGLCLRATFICDDKNIIQHVSMNALDTGRNVDGIINTVNALKAGGLTACNWQPGDNLIGE
jgi:peroxiredoxin (alkyl hydroperoxide reductase subunit C)